MTNLGDSAFFSYTHFDDEHDGGKLTLLRERLAGEVQAQTGKEFSIFQDKVGIKVGQQWKKRIQTSLEETVFYIPILTPSFFASAACREELQLFLKREQALGRDDLIIPIYYISCDQLDDKAVRDEDPLAKALAARQYADWRKLRHLGADASRVRSAVVNLTGQLRDALKRGSKVSGTSVPKLPRSRAVPTELRVMPGQITDSPGKVPVALKTAPVVTRAKPPILETPVRKPAEATEVIDSDAWLLLGDHFFLTASFDDQDDGTILVQIASPSLEDEAVIRDLERSVNRRDNPLGFAYKNRASLTALGPIKERSVGGKSTLVLVLKPHDRTGNSMMDFAVTENGRTYSPDEIAELRSRLLLLNQPLPSAGQHGYSLLSSGGYDVSVKATECVFPSVWRQYRNQPERFRHWARLVAVYFLLLSGVCEHILDLRLGPVKRGGMRVTFRGRRRKYYSNQDAAVITANGVCPLT